MLFNSFSFIILLAVTFFLFYLPRLKQWQTHILIASSFIFYAHDTPRLLLLLIASILFNASVSFWIVRKKPSRKFLLTVLAIIANVIVIALFKYGPLLGSLIPDAKSTGIGHFLLRLPLPIGISFYTFESISLIVDTYRGGTKTPFVHGNFYLHLINTTLFVAFFPHLISGPILKAHDFYPQIQPKDRSDIHWENVFKLLVVGYFLKMVVADNLKDLTFWMTYPFFLPLWSGFLVSCLFGFSIQIFADFAGYSLIAIGIAEMFGYRLIQNFCFPYISSSLAEFWQRWHISLSSWLREYLYFPLGGNRRGKFRTYFNLFLVMAIGGLWHGAALSYAIWGIYHGLGLALERAMASNKPSRVPLTGFFKAFKICSVFLFVTLGWLLFKMPNFDHAIAFCRAMFANWGENIQFSPVIYIMVYALPVLIYHYLHLFKSSAFRAFVIRYQHVIYGALIVGILLNSGSPGSFIYFQF